MTITSILADPSSTVVAEGIIEWANNKGAEVQGLIRTLVGVGVAGFIAAIAFKSHFAIAKTLVAIVVGGALIWVMWNITAVKDSVGDELPGSASPQSSEVVGVPDPIAAFI
ncbi:hypothetical protein [Rhodococcoides fascians]|uniref:hypothetical protein n=1 Tax=Rhodococcoides fascians TaxID=1828 RepID=UPI00050CFB08|nr:hypothetical protein [Rhodococcus fascians]